MELGIFLGRFISFRLTDISPSSSRWRLKRPQGGPPGPRSLEVITSLFKMVDSLLHSDDQTEYRRTGEKLLVPEQRKLIKK